MTKIQRAPAALPEPNSGDEQPQQRRWHTSSDHQGAIWLVNPGGVHVAKMNPDNSVEYQKTGAETIARVMNSMIRITTNDGALRWTDHRHIRRGVIVSLADVDNGEWTGRFAIRWRQDGAYDLLHNGRVVASGFETAALAKLNADARMADARAAHAGS